MDQESPGAALEAAFEERDRLGPGTSGAGRDAVETALDGLDAGRFRVAEKIGDAWHVHQWLKKAVLLSFRLSPMRAIEGGPRVPGGRTVCF